jgi:beta-glucosidase
MLSTQTPAAFAGLETAERLTPAQIEERARALRDQLSLDEKVSLMHGQLPFWPGLAAMAAPGGYRSQVWVAGEVPRLGIPGIRFSDGPRGVILEGATTFPRLPGPGRDLERGARRARGRGHRARIARPGRQLLRGRVHQPAAPPGPGAAPRKPTAKIPTTWALWARP